jgi:hypothetical protein
MPWRHMCEWRNSSIILDIVTRWRWVVSFTTQLLYFRGKNFRYPLDRRVGGPHIKFWRYGEEKNLILAWNQTPAVQPIAHHYVIWAIPTLSSHCLWALRSPFRNKAHHWPIRHSLRFPVITCMIDKEYTVYTTTIRVKTKTILQHQHLLYCIFIRDATCFDPFAGSSSGVQHQS